MIRALAVLFVLMQSMPIWADEDHFVCRIETKQQTGEKHEFTGFKVKGVDGIYTALHGLVGAQEIAAIFHDPKTRRIRLKLFQVDLDRDAALLKPIDETDSLPKGGLALGVWPSPEQLELAFAGKSAIVIGHPLGIDLKPTYSQLKIRSKRAVTRLTEVLNASARDELGPRGSPNTNIQILSLEGHFLPGHSGAPILDEENAVIGIGNGGLKEGQVGQGWAIPFHDLKLQSIDSIEVRERLSKIPPISSGQSLFLVVDESVRNQPDLLSQVVTTVESQDGSPIMGLKKMPAKESGSELNRMKEILEAIRKGDNKSFAAASEMQEILKNRVSLPSGTPVVILAEPEALASPVQTVDSERALQFAIGNLFTKVRAKTSLNGELDLFVPSTAIRRRSGDNIEAPQNSGIIVGGDNKGMIAGGNIIINPERPTVKKLILDNDGGQTVVLKEDITDPLYAMVDSQNHLGIAIRGTEVRMLEGRKLVNPVVIFRKVEILSGELKGKRGWVSQGAIQEVESR